MLLVNPEEMDLDQLDLNPRITAAIKKGMLCAVRGGTHALSGKLAVVYTTSAERLCSLSERGWSVSEGAPFPLGFLEGCGCQGELLALMCVSPFCRCASCFDISAMYFFLFLFSFLLIATGSHCIDQPGLGFTV